MSKADQLIRLYEDSKQPGTCRGCGARLEWFETLNGKQMPMNAGAVPRKSEQDPQSWRVVAFYAAEDSHWNTCSARVKFSVR
jgi:hypothetical protein